MSWVLSDDFVLFGLEFLAVEGLGVDSLAVVSHGSHGVSWGLLETWLGDVVGLLNEVGLDAGDIDSLLLVDEDGAWHLVGGGGWVVDGLSAWNLLVDGLKSGDLLWDLNGDLFLNNVLLNSLGGDWDLDGLLNLSDGGHWNLDDLFDLLGGGDWDLDGSLDLSDGFDWNLDGSLDLPGGGDWNLDGSLDLLGDLLWDLDGLGDLSGDLLWLLDGVVLSDGDWDLFGDGGWDLLGDDDVFVVAPVVVFVAFAVFGVGVVDEEVLEFVALLLDSLGGLDLSLLDNIDEDGLVNGLLDFLVDEDGLFDIFEDNFVFEVGLLDFFKDNFVFEVGLLDFVNDDLVNEVGLFLGGEFNLVDEVGLFNIGQDDLVNEVSLADFSLLGDIDGLELVNEDGLLNLNLSGGVAELVDGDEVVSGGGDLIECDLGVDNVDKFVVDLEGVNFGLSLLSNNIVSSDVLFTLNTLGGPGGAVDFLELDGWVGDESVSGSLLNSVIPDGGLGGASVESWLLSLLDVSDGSGGGSILSESALLGDWVVVGVEDWLVIPGHGGGGEKCDGEGLHLDDLFDVDFKIIVLPILAF